MIAGVLGLCLAGAVVFFSSIAAAQTAPASNARAATRTIFRDCPDCPEMVSVPAGQFMMGTEAWVASLEGLPPQIARWEEPRHPVTIRTSFALGRYDVTRDEFARFVKASGYKIASGCVTWTGERFAMSRDRSWRDPGFPQTDRDPVVCVSWTDATAYTAWLSHLTGKPYRLPTEAEWEYAARAGTVDSRWWGNDPNAACQYANGADLSLLQRIPASAVAQCRDGYVFTSPVGSFKANAFGLYDMLGDAWQWTEDCWRPGYFHPPDDARAVLSDADCSKHVLRGGSWGNGPGAIRSSARNQDDTDGRNAGGGFRVARTL